MPKPSSVPCHACLHEITFRRRQGARAATCTVYSMYRMSPAAKLLRGLDSRNHPAHLPPVRLCLTTVLFFVLRRRLQFPATPADAFDMCSEGLCGWPANSAWSVDLRLFTSKEGEEYCR